MVMHHNPYSGHRPHIRIRLFWGTDEKRYIAYCRRWPTISAAAKKPHKAVQRLMQSLQQQGLIDKHGRIT